MNTSIVESYGFQDRLKKLGVVGETTWNQNGLRFLNERELEAQLRYRRLEDIGT
jgi:hypothetical protein